MIPVALDPAALSIALVGRGDLAARRLGRLRAGGTHDLRVFSDAPEPVFSEAAAGSLVRRLPTADDLAAIQILWIVDLPERPARDLAAAARAAKVLVNREDDRAYCDFHNVAEVRRGDLLLTVSTNGASPGLAGLVRERLEKIFGEDWAAQLELVRRERQRWRSAGAGMAEVQRRTRATVETKGWPS